MLIQVQGELVAQTDSRVVPANPTAACRIAPEMVQAQGEIVGCQPTLQFLRWNGQGHGFAHDQPAATELIANTHDAARTGLREGGVHGQMLPDIGNPNVESAMEFSSRIAEPDPRAHLDDIERTVRVELVEQAHLGGNLRVGIENGVTLEMLEAVWCVLGDETPHESERDR